MDPNESAVRDEAAQLQGMIHVELLGLMSHAVMMGNHLRHLRVADVEKMRAVTRGAGLSDDHAALVIEVAERAARHRSEGCSNLTAIEVLTADRELLARLLDHTRRAVEGAH